MIGIGVVGIMNIVVKLYYCLDMLGLVISWGEVVGY